MTGRRPSGPDSQIFRWPQHKGQGREGASSHTHSGWHLAARQCAHDPYAIGTPYGLSLTITGCCPSRQAIPTV